MDLTQESARVIQRGLDGDSDFIGGNGPVPGGLSQLCILVNVMPDAHTDRQDIVRAPCAFPAPSEVSSASWCLLSFMWWVSCKIFFAGAAQSQQCILVMFILHVVGERQEILRAGFFRAALSPMVLHIGHMGVSRPCRHGTAPSLNQLFGEA